MTKTKSQLDFVPKGMQHSDFEIGTDFLTAAGRWRCTDVGKRTITAIRLDLDHDPAWYDGPPYAVVEYLFDEEDIEGCSPALGPRRHDDSGRRNITTVRIKRMRRRHKRSVVRRREAR